MTWVLALTLFGVIVTSILVAEAIRMEVYMIYVRYKWKKVVDQITIDKDQLLKDLQVIHLDDEEDLKDLDKLLKKKESELH